MKFGRKLFGLNPKEVYDEIEKNDETHKDTIEELKNKVEKVSLILEDSEKEVEDLKKQLSTYQEKERIISQVLVTAQMNADRILSEARENARNIMEKCNSELQLKNKELEKLRNKVSRFKEDFKEVLEKYRYSIEDMKDISSAPPAQSANNDKVRYISGND